MIKIGHSKLEKADNYEDLDVGYFWVELSFNYEYLFAVYKDANLIQHIAMVEGNYFFGISDLPIP